ncbi:MAG TPA: CBS domain-containing protein [Thermoanaerobaculia bacterium]|nr:CBS domain-containing protein [Thermoanaerobaculia bacterium]
MANTRTDRPLSTRTERETSGTGVRELMTRNPQTVTEQDSLQKAAKLMVECDCGSLPVVGGDGRLRGMITDRDIVVRVVAQGRNPLDATVRHAMTSEVFSVRESDSVENVFRLMGEKQVRRVPVVGDDGAIVGIIAQADLALEARADEKVGETVERISEPERRPGH